MKLTKNFEHHAAEEKWYQHWMDNGYFNSTPDDREPYTVVIPPPNVTGVLHMGHCLNNTIQDILVRRARMMGKNACWVPGTDHASIATEAKVVAMLRERGINKSMLSRDEFLAYAWEWKEKYGGIILQQLKKLGCSLDWNRTTFTMDPEYYSSVIKVFVDLHNKGHIYRGKRMINWDVKAKTALSDEEVIFKEVNSKLYHLRYQVADDNGNPISFSENEGITIATVRPETILGDTAICVNPTDERYTHLHGKFAFVPLINRRIPIITDDYVTIEFGTGALKVTPAHDMNDFQLGQKHKLEVVDILNDDGTLSKEAQIYIGEDRFAARKKIIVELEEKNHLVKAEEYTNQIGYSERTDVVVEPRLSLQWWVAMKSLSEPALNAVMDEDIKFHPAKFKNLYRHWMENIKDWCISRQLWWGHRIPAWYDADGNVYVAENADEALKQAKEKNSSISINDLRQDEDCLDTWFSSWLWPFEVFKGYSNPDNEEANYYYPTNSLVTAPEIIFFWVARMIIAGFEYKKEIPFRDVYFTGIVRDKQGRKMSKSLGNSPDLLGLIDKFGADAVRFGIMISSPAGNDLLFDESSIEQGRNFNNKLWNALKLIEMWKANAVLMSDYNSSESLQKATFAAGWFEGRLQEVKKELEVLYSQFRLSEALKTVYSLIWNDFCSWYLEWIKPPYGEPINGHLLSSTEKFFDELMQLLHPFMPFITEDIYQKITIKEKGDDLCISQLKDQRFFSPLHGDIPYLEYGKQLQQCITAIRDARNKAQLKPKDVIKLHLQTENVKAYDFIGKILIGQVNAESISFTDENIDNTIAVVTDTERFFIETDKVMDPAAQREELLKDLDYLKGFLFSVNKKLSNERFVQNAKPEVVEIEMKKRDDAMAKIKAIEESLETL